MSYSINNTNKSNKSRSMRIKTYHVNACISRDESGTIRLKPKQCRNEPREVLYIYGSNESSLGCQNLLLLGSYPRKLPKKTSTWLISHGCFNFKHSNEDPKRSHQSSVIGIRSQSGSRGLAGSRYPSYPRLAIPTSVYAALEI